MSSRRKSRSLGSSMSWRVKSPRSWGRRSRKIKFEGRAMSTIVFYRQARRDGGVRTGIEIDQNTVLARFDRGAGEEDPAVEWYLDVRCRGPRLPREPQAAREWLISHERRITALLRSMAEEVPLGMDASDWPLTRTSTIAPRISVE